MAGKRQNDIRKTASNLNSKWLQNTLKSMGVAGTEVIRDLMPATTETFSSASKFAADAARDIRNAKSGSNNVVNALKSNPAIKVGQDFFKNAITDIRTGNIYNTDRMSDFESEFMDGFDDISFGDMGDDDDASGDVNINNVIQDNGATLKAIQQQTEYQVRASKATVDSMVSIASASISKTNEIGSKVLSELATINTNLAAMVEYNNTNMTKFIEASIGYYEQMSAATAAESSSPTRVTQDKIYGIGGGLDFSNYKEYVKGNIKDLANDSMIGSITSMIIENKDAFITNPMGMIVKGVMKSAIPQVMKSSMQALDDSVKDFIPVILERIGELGDNDDGPFSMFSQTISKVFGIKTKRKTDFDTTKIIKGPMPYNGVANHTIVEIIPKYLRESNTYLKEIAEAVTGKSSNEMSKSFTGFDWETGKFKSVDEIRDGLYEQILSEVTSSFERSDFGKKMSSRGSLLTSDVDRDNYEKALTDFYSAMEKHDGMINFRNQDHMKELLDGVNASDSIKNLIQVSIEEMLEDTSSNLIGNAYRAKQTATRKKNNLMKSFEESASENGLYQADGVSYDDWYASRSNQGATVGGTASPRRVTASVPSLLQGIQDTLNRGIFVKIKKNLGPMPSGSTSSVTSSSSDSTESGTSQSKDELRDALRAEDSENASIQATLTRSNNGLVNETANKLSSFAGVLNGVMSGNADKAWEEFINGLGGVFKKASGFISEHFLDPMKKTLFGEKSEDGYLKGGIFQGVNNRMKESFFSLRRMITGKGYVTADGEVVEDANEDEMKNTVAGKLKGMLNYLKEGISLKLFGEKDEDGNKVEGKEGVIGKVKNGLFSITDSFHKGLNGWKTALFGENENTEEDQKKTWEDLKAKASEVMPNAITGSLTGGILGTLVGGPLGGALIGFAGGILSKSDKFKNWLFGEEDDNGERVGGVISKNIQDYMKKNGKLMAGAGAVGLASGAITGGGILGTLVGGPVAGAIMGIGTTMLMKSNMFQKFLFGDEDEGQKGLVNIVKGWFGKLGKSGDSASGGKLAGMMGIGTGVGALTLGAISKAGLLGLSLGPMGPIGGALAGLGLSILAQKDNFHEWLFGKTDENGIKREGILGQFKNMLGANVFGPLKDRVLNVADDFKTFLEYDILKKFNLVIEPIGDAIFGGLSKLTGKAMTSLSEFGDYIRHDFLQNLVEKTKNVLAPVTQAVGTVAEGIYNVGKHIISAPLNLMYAITSPIATAVGKVALGAISTVGNVVNTVLIKPVKTLVLKPLGGLLKAAGKVVAAPFIALGKVAEFVNTKVVSGVQHVTRFVGSILGDIKENLINKPIRFVGDWFKDKVAPKLTEAKDMIVDKVTKPFKIVGNLIKDGISNVTDFIKKKVSGLFGKMLGVITAPFRAIGKGIGALLGIGKDNKGGGIFGYFRDKWQNTAAGKFIKKDGDDYGTERANFENARRAARERNKQERQRRKDERWNQQQIAKYTKNQKMLDTEENRKLAAAMSGKDIKFRGSASDTEAKKIQAKIDEKQLDASVNTAEHTKDMRDYLKDIRNFIFNTKTPFRNRAEKMAYKGVGSFLKGETESTVDAFALGTDRAPSGPVIVGEKGVEAVYKKNSKFGKLVGIGGPEVVNMEGGETIIPNSRIARFENGTDDDGNFDHSKLSDEKLHQTKDDTKLTIGERLIKGISGLKLSMFGTVGTKVGAKIKSKLFGGVSDETSANNQNDKSKDAFASVSGLTGEKLRAMREAEREEESDDATQEGILASLKRLVVGQHEHNTVWNSIFSKKGLITGGLLLLAPLLFKFFNTDIGSMLSDWLSNLGSHLSFGLENLGDGKNPIEKIQDEVTDIKDVGATLLDGDVIGAANKFIYDENGNVTHQSGSRAKLLAKGGSKAIANGVGLLKKGKALGTFAKSGFKDDAAKAVLSKKAGKVGSNALVEWGTKTTKLNVGKLAGKNVDEVAESVSKGMLDNVIKAVKSFFSGVFEKISKVTGKKLGKLGTGLIDDVVKCLQKHFGKIAGKIGAILGVTAGLAATGVGLLAKEGTWVVLGAVNGATGAKRLFRTDRSDALMVTISTALGAFNGSTVGSICDVVNELVTSIIGLDMYTELATLIYSFLAGEEKANMLQADQEAFQDSYIEDRNNALAEQYATMQNAGLISPDITLDQFIEGASNGDYGASIQSFADYNDEQHKTLGAKIGDGFSSMGKGISKGAKNAWGAVVGKTETYYEDARGNKYRKNDDGTYQVTDADGNDLGYVGEGALPGDATKITEKTDGLVQKVGSFISPVVEKIGLALGTFKDMAVDSAKALVGGMKGIIENFNNKDMDFKDYLTADVNDMDEENPLHGLVGGILNVAKVVMFPKLVVFGVMKNIGKSIANTIKGLADKTGKVIQTYQSENNKIKSYSESGDILSLYRYNVNVPDDTPISGIVKGVLNASKFVHYIPGTVNFVGKSISDGIQILADKAKNVISMMGPEFSKVKGYADKGDVQGLAAYTPQFGDDTPISGVLNGVMQGYKIVMSPTTLIHATGNKIKETISDVTSKIKTTVDLIAPGTKTMFGYAKSGDISSLAAYNPSIPEGSPIGGVVNGILGISKTVFSPIASVVAFGKSVKETVAEKLAPAASLASDIKSYIKTLNGYTDPDKSMDGFASEKMAGSDDDPAKAVIAPIINKVMATYVRIVRAIKEFGDGIKDTIEDVTDGAAKVWDDVTAGAAEIGNNVKEGWNKGVEAAGNAFNSAGTWAMNLARGGWGTGVHGGRGPEPMMLNGSIYYSQNDPRWGSEKFIQSNGTDDGATMSSTGCGPTAMSMVISNMNNKPSSPVDLARLAQVSGERDETGTNWDFIDKASRQYGLVSNQTMTPSSKYLIDAISSGNPVLLSGTDNGSGSSPYTTAGHYVVAVGLDSNGNVIINDPRGSSYSRTMSPSQLAASTSSAWTFAHSSLSNTGGYGSGSVVGRFKNIIRGGRGVDRTRWIAVVQAVKQAIAAQRPGYSQTNHINITVGGKTIKVRTDCSGYVSACLKYYGVVPTGTEFSSAMITDMNYSPMVSSGFTPRPWSGWENLEAGDIITKNGHTEIYAGKDGGKYYVYNCGSDKSTNNPGPTGKSYAAYTTVWSPGPPGPDCITNVTVTNTGLDMTASVSSGSIFGSTAMSTGTSSIGGDIFSKISSAFTSVGSTLANALLGGNTNVDWNSVISGTGFASGGTALGGSTSDVSAANIPGSDNAQKTWNYLLGKGLPKYGVAGLMGNLYAESGIRPDNLQNSYEKRLGSDSEYTNAVNSGSYTGSQFAADKAGYGLAQWTSAGRKEGLYNLAKSSNRRIDDLGLQLDWLWHELNHGYPKVLSALKNASSVKEGSDYVLHKFEAPADQSASMENKRASFGMSYYEKYANGGSGTGAKLCARKYVGPRPIRGGGYGDIMAPIKTSLSTRSVGSSSGNVSNLTNNNINVDNTTVEALLAQAVKILTVISTNSNNLQLLKDINKGVGNTTNFISKTNNVSSNNGQSTKSPATGVLSSGEQTARRIAFGT